MSRLARAGKIQSALALVWPINVRATRRNGTRYMFGITEGEISGERTHKRRSAKHLGILPSLLEARRSILYEIEDAPRRTAVLFVAEELLVASERTVCSVQIGL